MTDTQLVTQSSAPARATENSTLFKARATRPPVDVVEDAMGITLWADLPGVSLADLDLQVHDSILHIKGESWTSTSDQLQLQHVEMRAPRFARSFALSPDFDTTKIEASLKDGLLKVSIPRHERAKPRRVDVRMG